MSKRQVVSFYKSKVRFSWLWYLNKRLVKVWDTLLSLMFFCSLLLLFLSLSTLAYIGFEKHYPDIGFNILEWVEDNFPFIMYYEGVLLASIVGTFVYVNGKRFFHRDLDAVVSFLVSEGLLKEHVEEVTLKLYEVGLLGEDELVFNRYVEATLDLDEQGLLERLSDYLGTDITGSRFQRFVKILRDWNNIKVYKVELKAD